MVILSCLDALGYAVEWRVINAADYGFPQRRRRVFILGYHQRTRIYKKLQKSDKEKWLLQDSIAAQEFPATKKTMLEIGSIPKDKNEIIPLFSKEKSPFQKAGLMIGGKYYTLDLQANYG